MWTSEVRLRWIVPILSISLVGEFFVTSGLWTANRAYPTVPVLASLPVLPQVPTIVLVFSLLIGSLAFAVWPARKWCGRLCVLAGLLLVCFDINRLQPWLYIYLAILTIIAMERQANAAWSTCAIVLVGTYFWSGVQKVNPVFGSEILPKLVEPLGPGVASLAERSWIVAPIFEAGIAALFFFPKTRTIGLAACVAMHAFLLLVLGPLGLNYNAAVWPWNVSMPLIAIALLFRSSETLFPSLVRRPIGICALFLFDLAPASAFLGADVGYLADEFYSGKLASAWIYLTPEGSRRLLRAYPAASHSMLELGPGVERLDVTAWSMEKTNAPPYPSRYAYGQLAKRLGASETPGSQIKLLVQDPLRRP